MNDVKNRISATVMEYIAVLRGKTRGGSSATELPQEPREGARRISSSNLVDVFIAEAAKINTRTYVTDKASWQDVLIEILGKNGIKSLLLAPLGDDLLSNENEAELHRRVAEHGIEICIGTEDETLFRVDAALTGVMAAIAEFGSLVCASSSREARGFSLIPPTHIAFVPASRIVPDLCDLFDDDLANQLPAGMSLITGPSKTADIEGVLVNGVHGPKTVHAICVRDA